jgi:uncharacterized membrane protein
MLTFGALWPLCLFLLIPGLWWVQRRTLTDVSPRQLWLSGTVRSAIVALLALALTEPIVYRSSASLSVIYLVDISESVSAGAIQSAIQWIQRTNDSVSPHHARYIPFGANAAVFDSVDRLKTARVARGSDDDGIDRSATDIERALDIAVQNFAPHHLKKLVLVTDGNENVGRLKNAVSRLRTQGIRVYTMPLQARTTGDAWAEAMLTPPDAAADEPFPVDVDVYAPTARPADVRIRSGDTLLGTRTVQLRPGLNRVAFETAVKGETGLVPLEAEVRTQGDTFADNNTVRGSVLVTTAPRVLYVEGHPDSAKYLLSALRLEGFVVTLLPPRQIPVAAGDLDAYDAIVLSDVPAGSLDSRQMRAIASYVQDLGGGLIVAGGENTFGAEGYSGTDVEKVLPVTFDAAKPRQSVAMIVVLDKSGSMGGAEIGFAKEATKAPLRTLRDVDSFGVVAFDSNFYWPVPLQSAANREQMIRSINTIVAGGETNVFPALEAAYAELAANPSEVKHVVLMSDGHTAQADFQSLLVKMAGAKITVSTVALGASADNVLLERIAGWGNGRTYFLTDASQVPDVFTDETEHATGTTLREQPFTPIVKKDVQAFKGIELAKAPALRGYVATKAKETAEVLLESRRKDPILARWHYGLGKTAAFTSDVKDRWSVDWLRWKEYSKFWAQLVRETLRARDDGDFDLRVARDGDRATVTIDAIQRDGRFRNKLDSRLRVVTPDRSVLDVPVRQVGPGSYEAEVGLSRKGSYVFHVIGDGGQRSRALEYSDAAEYHFYPPNTNLLREVSAETNGRFQPQAEDIFDTHGETVSIPTGLWPYLALLALCLYVGDVFLRRVRVLE